jgi:hypothetical protein
MIRIPLAPKNPDRICWGCDKYCPADDLACGNGTIRTLHPCELFGNDWHDWVTEKEKTTDRRRHRARGSVDPLQPVV